ncbi:glycine/sarcosine/betaine reductase component B subunit [Oscillibacter sp. MSJ-2]|uniref:Glycine/sarcosine/betaine reductase component B subunit n=1 Tax=Dysosmobacter acutus TaxID=2841504 RepID=A0ABS6F687_9FIRM|nr:glycine/sarcosine/betaine reductase component B subunit [Dysosmobacter acutus]MBU5625677.1 glycine/sarcosine/betaine reductase component B subunit [Dysosmobacter acutus]
MRNIAIRDIAFAERSEIRDHVLYLRTEEMKEEVMKDTRVKDVVFHIARPGESVRIVPVKDVIEPRAKVGGGTFSGVTTDEPQELGSGITYALKGCAVVSTGPIVGFQEGLIDMSGPAADYTIFSKLNNVVMELTKRDGISPHEHEEVVRLAGIRLAEHIGRLALDYADYTEEVYTWGPVGERYAQHPSLPKVVYVDQIMSQGLLHDTYYYGRDSKLMLPMMLSPLELLDDALISGNCVSPGSKTTTYHHQNNAVVQACFAKHGTELNFMGVVVNPLMVTLKEKLRNCMLTTKYARELGAEGVVVSQEGFGNPTTDLMLVARNMEHSGIKAVIITNEDAGLDGMSESLPDSVKEADAIISTGNSNATLLLPKMDKVIGELTAIEHVTGGNSESIQPDGSLVVEIHGIIGSHNLQGNTHLSAITI